MVEIGKKSIRSTLFPLLLIASAVVGNYFKLSLFYGFDFLFGSIFLMILLNLYGVAWGFVAALIATSCTYLYWHHPYGFIVFSLEILSVGLLVRRKNYNLLLSDGLFWLCIGTPLNWFLYFYVMKAGYHSALLVVLKQAVNGIFNTLIASILLDFLPIRNWVGESGIRKKVSIQQALFHLILAMILFPAIVIMIINSRKAFFDIEIGIAQKLKNTTVDAAHDIDAFLQRDRFNGDASAAGDRNGIDGELDRIATTWGVAALILDERGQVIFATKDAFRPMEPVDFLKSGEMRPLKTGISLWLPPVRTAKSAFDRWKRSFYVMETTIGKNTSLKILLAAPTAPYQKQLYESTYINSFSFMLVIIAGSIFLSVFLSRRLVSTIEKLESVTTDLPSRIALEKTVDWPDSYLSEIHSLVTNFKIMTSSLSDKFRELNTSNTSLQEEITTRRRIEEILADEKERLSVTLLSIGDGVISADTVGRVLLINKAALELLGGTQAEFSGKLLSEIFRTFDAKDPEKEIYPLRDATTQGGSHVVPDDLLLVSRDGAKHIVSTNFEPIRNREGSIIGEVLVCRDNTERRKIEEKLQNAQKLESIGRLAAGIAHDFNNLLSAILGNLSLVKAEGGDAAIERLLEIEKASLRAKDLARQLLTFSKGGAPIRKTASILELIRQSATFATRGSSARCEFHLATDLRAVNADEGQLGQAIRNLVSNAAEAMPGGGVIRIFAENIRADADLNRMGLDGDVVKVSVRDEGPGIPAGDLPKIFDPFFTTKAAGSGMGLATVYSIIGRHDGHVEAECRPGEGATFHIYLPASDKPLEERAAPDPVSRNGKGTILVMDDEEPIRKLARAMLGHLGFDVVCAQDGAEAVDLYKRSAAAGNPFDGVIMDLTVPGGMGGKEAIGLLKEFDPGIRAIVSSGYSSDPILADPGKFGFSGIVTKPYTLVALREAVYRVVHAKGESGRTRR